MKRFVLKAWEPCYNIDISNMAFLLHVQSTGLTIYLIAGSQKVSRWSSIWNPPSYAPHCSFKLISLPRLWRQLFEGVVKNHASPSSSAWSPDPTRGWWYWFCTSRETRENRHHGLQRAPRENKYAYKLWFLQLMHFITLRLTNEEEYLVGS